MYDIILPISMFHVSKKSAYAELAPNGKGGFVERKMQTWILMIDASTFEAHIGHDMQKQGPMIWHAVRFTIAGTRGDVNFTYAGIVPGPGNVGDIVGWQYAPATPRERKILDCANVTVYVIRT